MGKGKRVAVKADEAIEFTQAELVTLLQSDSKRLAELLATKNINFDPTSKVVLGFVDRSDPLKIRTLFNEDNKIPVQDELIETDLHVYKRKCTNGGANAGVQSVKIEPAANSIVQIYFASMLNGDATDAKSLYARVDTAGGTLFGYLFGASTAANAIIVWPRNVTGTSNFDLIKPFILTDAIELYMYTASIDVSEDVNFIILYQYTGTGPTITETNPAGATWSDIS